MSLRSRLQSAAVAGEMRSVLPTGPHFPPKAKRLIMLFLTGGMSHVDTFDPKPALLRDKGKIVDGPSLRDVAKLPLLPSPFKFSPRGESGLMISELFPHLSQFADDLCVIRSMHTDIVEHFQASLAMHTGSATVPLPSLGAWLGYGLGTDNPNLPPYVVFCEHLPYGGSQLWDSNFPAASASGDARHSRQGSNSKFAPADCRRHDPASRWKPRCSTI